MKSTQLLLLLTFISLNLPSQTNYEPKLCTISELCDVKQEIHPETYTFFTTPLFGYEMLKLYDIEEFVLCCYSYHLDVYNKKNGAWQIFTPSDDYLPITASVQFSENYEDYFLIFGNNKYYQKDVINVFDKRNSRIFSLDYDEYSRLKEDWKPVKLKVNPDTSWYVEKDYPYSIIREDLKTGQKSSFSYNDIFINHYNMLISGEDKIIAGKENGIIFYDNERDYRYLNSSNVLYSGHISDYSVYGDSLIVLYDSVVDLIDLNTFNLVKRVNLHASADHALLLGDDLFYVQFDKIFHLDLAGNSLIFTARLNNRIDRLFYQEPYLFLETAIGITSYNIRDRNVNHYGNNTLVEIEENGDEDPGEYNYPSFTFLGKLDNDFIAMTRYWSYEDSILKVDLIRFRGGKVSTDTLVIPGEIANEMAKSRQCKIENYHLLIAGDTLINVYEINPADNSVYAVNSGYDFKFAKIYSGGLVKNNLTRYIPNSFERQSAYPVGKEITNMAFKDDVLWITTDKGLFSYNVIQEKWTSHFIGTTFLLGDRLLMVTKDDIYFGGGNAVNDWPASKIDRKNYMIRYFYSDAPKVWINSFKNNDKEIIASSPKGIYCYNYLQDSMRLIPTPAPIGQASFYGDGYLVADGNSIYNIDNQGIIHDTFKLTRHMDKDLGREAPALMEVDDQTIWLSSYNSFGNLKLTAFNLKDGSQSDFISRQPIVRILPGKSFTWILTEENIYRFDKERGELIDLGNIKNTSYREPKKAKINDGILIGNILYLACVDGIYRLNTETMNVDKIDMDFYEHFIPRSIKYDHSLFFIGTQIGVMQFKDDYFDGQFKSDLFLQISGEEERKLMLPFYAPYTIFVNDPQYPVSLTFDLENELADIHFDHILPNKNLVASIDTLNISIKRLIGTNPEIKNIYSITLDPEIIARDNFDLMIFFKDMEGNSEMLKKWTFNIKRTSNTQTGH